MRSALIQIAGYGSALALFILLTGCSNLSMQCAGTYTGENVSRK